MVLKLRQTARFPLKICWPHPGPLVVSLTALGGPTWGCPALGIRLPLIPICVPKRITGSAVGIALIQQGLTPGQGTQRLLAGPQLPLSVLLRPQGSGRVLLSCLGKTNACFPTASSGRYTTCDGSWTRDANSVQAEIPLGSLTHNPFTTLHLTSCACRALPNCRQTQISFISLSKAVKSSKRTLPKVKEEQSLTTRPVMLTKQ